MALCQVSGVKVYQKGEAQTADEIIVEFDFMWSGQQVMLVMCCCSLSCHDRPLHCTNIALLQDRRRPAILQRQWRNR